jgi:assimilatory nitrate reductase catalytic subunit
MKSLKRQIGLDILAEQYSYASDPEHGYTSAQKIPDRWVSTTCGYCSVGCGMFVGVKDDRAVAVRGNPNHPVNLGKLCPKGLSEHHTLEASNRAKHPLLRKHGKLTKVGWNEALDTLVQKFRATQQRHGRNSLGVISTGQLVTEEFYALGKLVQLGFGTSNFDGNTRFAWPPPYPATNSPSAAMALLALMRTWRRPTSSCSSAPTSPRIIRSCASTWKPTRTRR